MAVIGYGICLAISLVIIISMAIKNYDNVDIYYWTLIILNPIIILGYMLRAMVTTPSAYYTTMCFIYIDSTVFISVVLLSLLRIIGVKPRPLTKIITYGLAFLHMAMVILCSGTDLYLTDIVIKKNIFGYYADYVDGPLKIIHYVYMVVLFLVMIGILVAGYMRKGTYSRRTLIVYTSALVIGLIVYVIETLTGFRFTFLPLLYTIAGVFIAKDYDFMHAHDITGIVADQYESSKHGYAAISFSKTLLCTNEECKNFMPFFAKQRIDSLITKDDEHSKLLLKLIDDFKNGRSASAEFKSGDKICVSEISYFSLRKDGISQGYLIDIRDATEEKRTLQILENYNSTLNEEVLQKTEHIKNIQRSVVLGMADMIENRDSNTGGHVKRTSSIINIIVDEIKKCGSHDIDDRFANDVTRAAPMHDLGKLQIDSSILCKPGKLTDEEYEIMKTHSSKSGEMVNILLANIEESSFVKTAYNIARHHHERWDGHGYPDKLAGEAIPLEARIMAIADVYDALVSKRCYKEKMSFEKAAEIMCENMGSQFDPNMKQVFLGCQKKLEEYYMNAVDE